MNSTVPLILENPGELARFGVLKAAVAIGTFDGVHQGHRKLLQELLGLASEIGAVPCALTFHPHPRSVIAGKNAPPLLLSEEEKYRLLHNAGAEYVIVLPFTESFSRLQPEEFIQRTLSSGNVQITGVCVGSSWRFGANASGTADDLQKMSEKYHFSFRAVKESCMPDGKVISSTLIRKAVMEGNLSLAEQMLGRKYTVTGTVIHGMGLAGSELGHPTANLQMDAGVIPPCGVYACRVFISESLPPHSGVMSIGYAPTVRDNKKPEIRIEVHIHDFNGDLYGQKISAEPWLYLRNEMKFASLDELKKQIVEDSQKAFAIIHGG